MKRLSLPAPLLLLLSGCGLMHPSGESTGWRFEIGAPSVVRTSAIIQQTSGNVVGMPLSAGPSGPSVSTAITPAGAAGEILPPPRFYPAPAGPCELGAINAKLDAVLQRLNVKPE